MKSQLASALSKVEQEQAACRILESKLSDLESDKTAIERNQAALEEARSEGESLKSEIAAVSQRRIVLIRSAIEFSRFRIDCRRVLWSLVAVASSVFFFGFWFLHVFFFMSQS